MEPLQIQVVPIRAWLRVSCGIVVLACCTLAVAHYITDEPGISAEDVDKRFGMLEANIKALEADINTLGMQLHSDIRNTRSSWWTAQLKPVIEETVEGQLEDRFKESMAPEPSPGPDDKPAEVQVSRALSDRLDNLNTRLKNIEDDWIPLLDDFDELDSRVHEIERNASASEGPTTPAGSAGGADDGRDSKRPGDGQ